MLDKGARSYSQYSSLAVALSYKFDTVIIPLVPFLKGSHAQDVSPGDRRFAVFTQDTYIKYIA